MEQRNWKFDYLKGISCIIVVFFHCPLYGTVGDAIIYALRFPIPIFFMITGYYCFKKDNQWIINKIKKLCLILAFTEFFYMLWYVIKNVLMGAGNITQPLLCGSTFLHILRKLLCGSFFNGTLWYIYAIIWTYVIILGFRKLHVTDNPLACMSISAALIIVQVIGRYLVTLYFDISELVYLFRNAITFGLPMVLIGSEFARWEGKRKIPLKIDLAMIALGGVLLICEFLVSHRYMDFHFSTLFISVGIFALAFVYQKEQIFLKKVFCALGRKLSMWIYLVQAFVIDAVTLLGQSLGISGSKLFQIAMPVFVCLSIIALASIVEKAVKNGLCRKS